MLNLVLGVGVFALLPKNGRGRGWAGPYSDRYEVELELLFLRKPAQNGKFGKQQKIRGSPGRPQGGDNFTSLFKCSRPFVQSVKSLDGRNRAIQIENR